MDAITPYLTGKTHVIWDWNGTLLNDVELCLGIMQRTVARYGLREISREEHRAKFQMPIAQYYESLGFDLEKIPFERLNQEFILEYQSRLTECRLFEGAEDFLSQLKDQGKEMAVLSAANQLHLEELLNQFRIDHFFNAIFGLPDTQARCKIDRGRQLLTTWNAPKESTILIGDMDHDYHVAQALGIDILLLGDGHQSYERLIVEHPNCLQNRSNTDPTPR